jgi:hypothetical protein
MVVPDNWVLWLKTGLLSPNWDLKYWMRFNVCLVFLSLSFYCEVYRDFPDFSFMNYIQAFEGISGYN